MTLNWSILLIAWGILAVEVGIALIISHYREKGGKQNGISRQSQKGKDRAES